MKLDDCEEVRNIWTEVKFVVAKYINEVMLKIDPKGILIAQDIKTGKIIFHWIDHFSKMYVNTLFVMVELTLIYEIYDANHFSKNLIQFNCDNFENHIKNNFKIFINSISEAEVHSFVIRVCM